MEGFTPAEEDIRERREKNQRERYINLLKDLIGLLDGHPEFPEPYVNPDGRLHFTFHGNGARERLAAVMRTLRGGWTKNPVETEDSSYFECKGEWRGYAVILSTSRSTVCKRVVKGTREVTEKIKDPEKLAEVPEIEVTRTEDIVEWVCEPITKPEAASAPAGTEAAA